MAVLIIAGFVLVVALAHFVEMRQRREDPTLWHDVTLAMPVWFADGPTIFVQRRERPDGVIEIRRRRPTDDEVDFLSHK